MAKALFWGFFLRWSRKVLGQLYFRPRPLGFDTAGRNKVALRLITFYLCCRNWSWKSGRSTLPARRIRTTSAPDKSSNTSTTSLPTSSSWFTSSTPSPSLPKRASHRPVLEPRPPPICFKSTSEPHSLLRSVKRHPHFLKKPMLNIFKSLPLSGFGIRMVSQRWRFSTWRDGILNKN